MFKSQSQERGAALVEAALVLPLLLMLLVGIVEFGRVWNAQLSLSHAAREGIREYVVSGDETAAVNVATAAATTTVGVITVAPTCDPDDETDVGTAITMTIPATVEITIPFWPGDGIFNLTGVGTMRCGG